MKITKTLAAEAATAMASVVYDDKIKEQHANLTATYVSLLRKNIPLDVLAFCAEYPEWIPTSNDVYIYLNGQSYHETISFTIPSFRRNLKDVIKPDEVKEITAAVSKLDQIIREKENFEERTQYYLMSLKSRQRIAETFPEAMEYINWPSDPTKFLPMAKFEETRFLLNQIKRENNQ